MKLNWFWCPLCGPSIAYSCCGVGACTGGGCNSEQEHREYEEYIKLIANEEVPIKEPEDIDEIREYYMNQIFGGKSEGNNSGK